MKDAGAELKAPIEGREDALLRRYVSGDRMAAKEMAETFLPLALRYAHRFLGDPVEAEDVAQEAMMRLWRMAPDWQPGQAKVSTWLYRVTANLCIDRSRKKPMASLEDAGDPIDAAKSAVAQLQSKTRHDVLQAALLELPDRQRQAVVLRHIEGLSNPEIAQVMDISARAVESLTARGKAALADLLVHRRSELGFEDDE